MLKYLLEIRNRLTLLLIMFFSTLLVCYYYKNALLFLITQMHLNNENLYFIFTDVTELFSVYLKLIFFISTQMFLWYFFYYLSSFLAPALYFQEFKFISHFFNSAAFFWVLAGLLSSYVLIPLGWNFFLSFQDSEGFYFEARISEYLVFYSNAYFVCLIYFELLSLIFFFLMDIQKNYTYVKQYRKLYYYMFLLFSTLVTPPDLVSQLVTTFLVIMVYELVLLLFMLSQVTSSS